MDACHSSLRLYANKGTRNVPHSFIESKKLPFGSHTAVAFATLFHFPEAVNWRELKSHRHFGGGFFFSCSGCFFFLCLLGL